MSQPVQTLEQIFDAHLRVLATTLRPNTVALYRQPARHFLSYLHTLFPQVRKLSQLPGRLMDADFSPGPGLLVFVPVCDLKDRAISGPHS